MPDFTCTYCGREYETPPFHCTSDDCPGVKPHELFEIWEPDTVAECLSGVSKVEGLYGRLWELVEEAYEGYEKPETPDTHFGHVFGNELAKVWQRLSAMDQLTLNHLAELHEKED